MDRDLASLLWGLDEAHENFPRNLRDARFTLRLVVEECNYRLPVRASSSPLCPPPPPRRFEPDCHTVFLSSHVTDASETFHDLIDATCDYADAINNAGIVQVLEVVNFTMVSLPNNLHRLFPNVKLVRIVNCPRLSSLSAVVNQFVHLTHLSCVGCESLSSLASLLTLPVESHLKTLEFCRCGLRVTSEDDWKPGMEGLARMGRGPEIHGVADTMHLLIKGCDSLDCIPPSIGILSDTAKDLVVLYLKGNKNLRHLPHVLGEIPKLNSLVIDNCPRITRLPWSLSRTGIELSGMGKLISSLGLKNEARGCEPYFTIQPGALDRYFSAYRKRLCRGLFRLVMLVGRSRKRAIDRLCCPGGLWYERSRESFLAAVADMNR